MSTMVKVVLLEPVRSDEAYRRLTNTDIHVLETLFKRSTCMLECAHQLLHVLSQIDVERHFMPTSN